MSSSSPPARVVVPEAVRAEILSHAREGAPEEVCGVLAGVRCGGGESDEHRVDTAHPAENVADRPRTRYEIDPREQLELMEAVEHAGREVVGFYHSHPRGPPRPSATDAAQATWPGRSYVIVSLEPDDDDQSGAAPGRARSAAASVGSWRWTGEEFVSEEVRIVEEDRTDE